jgi:hypothetical protein
MLLEGGAHAGLWDGLASLVEAEGFAVLRVPHEGMIGGANGLTDYTAKTVAVRENMDPAAQVKTFAHELAHVRLHGPDNPEESGHRGISEVEAESVALMVGAAHGMDTTGYTIPYVSGWAVTVKDKDPAEVVQSTGEKVRKTAGTILDALPTASRPVTRRALSVRPGLPRVPSTHRLRRSKPPGLHVRRLLRRGGCDGRGWPVHLN